MSAVPLARRPFESGFQLMEAWALRGGGEDGGVGVDEVAEDELVGERGPPSVNHLKLRAVGDLRFRLLEVVALVAEIENHEGGFGGLRGSAVEGGHTVNRSGEEMRAGVSAGAGEEGVEFVRGDFGGVGRAGAARVPAVDEADAGVGFGAEGLLVEGYALVAGGGRRS